jgi:hypothetical protein
MAAGNYDLHGAFEMVADTGQPDTGMTTLVPMKKMLLRLGLLVMMILIIPHAQNMIPE